MFPTWVIAPEGMDILRNRLLRRQKHTLENLGGAMFPTWVVAPEGMDILRNRLLRRQKHTLENLGGALMRAVFTAELNELHTHFTEMGLLVNRAVEQAVQAFVNHDRELAQTVIEQDKKINQSELILEEKSFELIALQQPVTTDLRIIMTIIKASSDLERMGDHAVSIAKSTIRVKGQIRVPAIEQALAKMATTVRGMLSAALTAYVQENEPHARQIAAEDQQVNQAFQDIYQQCIQEMQQHPETVVGATDYLLVATYLERIGDYVTNLCEWVVYLKTNHLVELNNHNETM